MLISVIVPVYNNAPHVGEAILSILAQRVDVPVEIIVVDDGSTDGTLAELRCFGDAIHVLSRENGGAAAARNTGLAAANGSLIGFLDADDLWTDRHLASLLPLLDDASVDLARGWTRIVHLGASEIETRELFQPALVGACLYRRAVFDRVGTFDEALRLGEDIDLHARIADAGCREARLDDVVLVYRRHAAATVKTPDHIQRGQFDALRRRLARTNRE